MGRNYYGVPGVNPDFEDGDYYYEYEQINEEEVPEPPYLQALALFLVGLPILPIWSGLAILIALFKISFYSERDPEESQRWGYFLNWYIRFFVAGILMYIFFLPKFLHFFYIYTI